MTSREVINPMTGNAEELLKQEENNRPDLQADNTGYNRISRSGLDIYKTAENQPKKGL